MYSNNSSYQSAKTLYYKKFGANFLFFFLISSVYHLLRNVKTTLIMTIDGSGANTIPFITTCCVLPFSIWITYIFMKLSSKYNREKVFYFMTGGFLFYFILFTFILLPNQKYLELSYIANFLKQNILLRTGFDGLISTIRYWNIALFYTIAEVWGSIILIVLAWGFTNENNNMHTAKREYSFWGIGINSAGIFIGFIASLLILMPLPNISFYEDNYQWAFYQLLMAIIIIISIIVLFSYINNLFAKHVNPSYLSEETRLKFSLSKSFSLIKKSRYITYIAIIILSYNIIWNLTEVIWLYRTKIIYGDSKLFYDYMNKITIATGFFAVILGGLIFGYIVRNKSWRYSALVTPIVWIVSGIFFYLAMLFEKVLLLDMFYMFIDNPANLILILCTVQIVLGRSCKYTIFDLTKEMCFIPLSKEKARKGKSIVDGIGSRLGKSLGAIIYILLLIMFGEVSTTIPFAVILIIGITVLWIYSILKIDILIHKENERNKYNSHKS